MRYVIFADIDTPSWNAEEISSYDSLAEAKQFIKDLAPEEFSEGLFIQDLETGTVYVAHNFGHSWEVIVQRD